MCGAKSAGNIANDLPRCNNNTFIKERKEVKQMAKKKLSKFAAISMAAAMMLTAVMPTIPVFAAEGPFACNHPETGMEITKNATCTADGIYNEVCSICGITLKKGLTYKALGHSYSKAAIKNGKIQTLSCDRCGKTEDFTPCANETICTHGNTKRVNTTAFDCENDGYTGDEVCLDCGKVTEKGKILPHPGHNFVKGTTIEEATCTKDGKTFYYCENCGKKKIEVLPASHTWNEGEIILAPTTAAEGKRKFTCTVCGETKEETLSKLHSKEDKNPTNNEKQNTTDTCLMKLGSKFTVSGNVYKVTKENKEVCFIKAKKKAKTVIIPATVTNKGVTYKVTSIAAKAVKNNKKVKSVVIGANVKSISNNAFIKCPALKKINIKSTLLTKKTASKKALKSVNKKLTVKVPKKVKKEYKKIFKGLKIK